MLAFLSSDEYLSYGDTGQHARSFVIRRAKAKGVPIADIRAAVLKFGERVTLAKSALGASSKSPLPREMLFVFKKFCVDQGVLTEADWPDVKLPKAQPAEG